MATNATNTEQLPHKDNTTLWTTVAIIVVAALAFAGYAAYRNNYNARTHTASVSTDTGPRTTTTNP